MKNHLSILIITHPLVAANARGQGSGNAQMLQHLSAGGASHTVANGVAVAYALRENLRSLGAKCWRISGATSTPSGFGYGPKLAPTMTEGGEGLRQFDYHDTALRGFMFAKKGSGANKKAGDGEEVDTPKARGCLQMSPALSATPYDDGDTAFVKGLKEDGKLNPFTFQRHLARYVEVWTFDLATLAKNGKLDSVGLALDSLLAGLKVGGSHTSNLSEFTPEVLVWRFHTPGCGGLFLSPKDTSGWTPDKPVDLGPLFRKADDLGIRDEIQVGGLSVNPECSVAEAVQQIKQQIKQG